VALLGLGCAALLVGVRRFFPATAPRIVLVALLGVLAGPLTSLWAISQLPDARGPIYRAVGGWLRANTPVDARVGALEVGMIGYYSGRTMVDFAGLLQPLTAQQFGPHSSYDQAASFATQTFRPDYVVLVAGQLPQYERSPLFTQRCRETARVRSAGPIAEMVVYRCVGERG
jgi:hypothetical protein